MTLATLLRYLIGSRAAILKVASAPRAVWLGALLVLSAGLAREYDAVDLMHEPWRLLVPFVASLGTSFLLYLLVYLTACANSAERPHFARAYITFLSLYWMTAPLAWLYALPVERWNSAGDATRLNLCLLGLVSIWRVTLMTRVVHVLFGAGTVAAFWIVMLFGDTVALVILQFTPVPILNFMGGIPLTESEVLIRDTALVVIFVGGISWIVWFLGYCMILGIGGRNWRFALSASPSPSSESSGVGRGVWYFAVGAILVWGFILPYTQPEQQFRRSVEEKLADNDIAEAMRIMSEHEPEDFPPHWIPPPHLAFPNPHPPLLAVLEAIVAADAAPWVRGVFVEKLETRLQSGLEFGEPYWDRLSPDGKARFLDVIERLPEGRALVARNPRVFSHIATKEIDAGLRERAAALQAGEAPPEH